jgi:hypothetical protein
VTSQEAIASVKVGRRAWTPYSLHKGESRTSATCGHPKWRAIACEAGEDVIECLDCGQQKVVTCKKGA